MKRKFKTADMLVWYQICDQVLHIKFWWLKACLGYSQKFELERLISECIHSPCEKNLVPLREKHQVSSERTNRLKHSGKINLLKRWTNRWAGWVRAGETPWASGDFLGSSTCLWTFHYLLFILNPLLLTCCFGPSLFPCLSSLFVCPRSSCTAPPSSWIRTRFPFA